MPSVTRDNFCSRGIQKFWSQSTIRAWGGKHGKIPGKHFKLELLHIQLERIGDGQTDRGENNPAVPPEYTPQFFRV